MQIHRTSAPRLVSIARSFRRPALLVLAAAAFSVAGLPGGTASAQQVMVTSRIGSAGFGGSGQISKRSVDRYAEMLGMSAEQKEAALTMHSGYAAAYAARQKAMRDAMDEIRRTAEDSGDHTVFMEKMPGIQKENREATAKLEKDFFADLKSLLSGAAQEERWPKVERARRREVGLRQGQLSGENVDLIEVVATLNLTGEAAKGVAQVLDAYEIELDQQLTARDAGKSDEPAFEPGKPMNFDIEKLQKQMAEAREAGMKIVDVNQNNARKIEGLLPDQERDAFKAAFRKASFPRVYRESRVAKELDASLKLSDLDASQREQVEALRESYAREIAPINNSWASAIEAQDKSGNNAGIAGGGGMIMMSNGDEPAALKDARKARRELDEKIGKKLRGILRPDQKEKLPKAFEGDEPEGVVGSGIMMISEER